MKSLKVTIRIVQDNENVKHWKYKKSDGICCIFNYSTNYTSEMTEQDSQFLKDNNIPEKVHVVQDTIYLI